MSKSSPTALYLLFQNGDIPNASAFQDLIDTPLWLAASGQESLTTTASIKAGSNVSLSYAASVITINATAAPFQISASTATTLTTTASIQSGSNVELIQTGSVIQINVASAISLPSGVVASPTLIWSDTGFYRSNANELSISYSGSQTYQFASTTAKFYRNGNTTFDGFQFTGVRRSGTGGSISNGDVILDYAYNAVLGAGETQVGLIRVTVPNSSASYLTDIQFYGSASGTLAQRMLIYGANVVIGNAAIATNATDGFLYIDTMAGSPTGTPTSFSGRAAIVYDTTGSKLYVYNSAWKSVALT